MKADRNVLSKPKLRAEPGSLLLGSILSKGHPSSPEGWLSAQRKRTRRQCKVCKDTGRVKVRGQVGRSQPCSCDKGFEPSGQRADSVIDALGVSAPRDKPPR